MVIDDVAHLNSLPQQIKLDMVCVMLCMDGQMQISIDGEPRNLHKGQLMVCASSAVLSQYMASPDLRMIAIGLSTEIINKRVLSATNFWNSASQVSNNRVVDVDEESAQLLSNCYNIVKICHNNETLNGRKQILGNVQEIVIYVLINSLSREPQTDMTVNAGIKQRDLLFKDFMNLLVEHGTRLHHVSDYAKLLNVTPKYLSTAVKSVSGKTVIRWIHEFLVKEIKQRLDYTDLTIKQVAMELNFDNLSFFGHFFRKYAGMSPKNYRQRNK